MSFGSWLLFALLASAIIGTGNAITRVKEAQLSRHLAESGFAIAVFTFAVLACGALEGMNSVFATYAAHPSEQLWSGIVFMWVLIALQGTLLAGCARAVLAGMNNERSLYIGIGVAFLLVACLLGMLAWISSFGLLVGSAMS